MGIDAVGDVLGAVPQDELYDLLIDVGVGQERRAGVPAVVGQVVHRSQYGRSLPKMVAQPVIISDRSPVGVDDHVLVFRVVHGDDEGLDLVGQGDDPVPAGRRLHTGPEIVVGQVYVFRSGPQELYTLSLHDALPIWAPASSVCCHSVLISAGVKGLCSRDCCSVGRLVILA